MGFLNTRAVDVADDADGLAPSYFGFLCGDALAAPDAGRFFVVSMAIWAVGGMRGDFVEAPTQILLDDVYT